MADYTRLIEFKVKDTDLNRAVNKLTKTLTRIDKTLVGIDKKLDHIAKQGFGFVAREATKAERSVSKLGKSMQSLSSPQGLAKSAVSGAFGFLSGNKGEIARRVAELGAFDGILRKVTNGNTGLPAFNRRVTEAATALTGFGVAHAGAILGIGAGGVAIVKGTELFYNLGKGVRQAEANLIDFLKTSQQVGLGKNLKSLLPSFKPGSRLGGADSRFLPGGMAIDGKAMEEATRLTGQSSRLVLESLRSRAQALANNKKIQENLVALTGKHLNATLQVKRTQFQYNLELAKTRLVQAAVTADIWAAQKAWQGIVGTLKSATGLLGGLLGGKFGGLGQAAGVIGTTRSIEFLIKQLDKVNIHFLDGAKNAATWAARVTEAIAGVNLAYSGLNSVLSAATWVTSAVKGFLDFERAAVTAFHNVQAARRKMERNRGSFQQNTLLQNLFGPLAQMLDGRMGDKLKEIYGGADAGFGQEEQAFRGMSDRTPYGQRLTNELEEARQKLSELRSTNDDFAKQVSRVLTLESRVNDELAKQQKIKEETLAVQNKLKEMEQRDPIAQKELENEKQLRAARADRAKDNKQQLSRELKGIADRKEALERLYARQKAKEQEQIALVKQQERLRAESRRRRGRMAENLMLGAGFPLLFGGGAGAVGGGVLGAGLQAVSGSQGFGAQILLSALGQQFDAFASKVATLGQAFTAIDKDVTPVVEALGLTGSAFEKQIKILNDLGEKEAAFNLAREKMIELVGGSGVDALTEFGTDTKALTDDWSRLMTQMGAGLAAMINSAGILKALAESINKVVILNQAIENKDNDPELTRLNKIFDKYSTGEIRPGGLTNKGERHDFPSMMELNEMLVARQKILNTNNLSLKTDKIRTLTFDAQIAKLKEKLDLSNATSKEEKAALTIEKEVSEILNKFKEADIVLTKVQIENIRTYVTELNKVKPEVEKLNQAWRETGVAIRDGLVEGINAAIDGTKTLGEVASNVFRRISNALMNYGIDMLLMGMTGGTSGFFGQALGYDKRAAGGPVKGNSPYIVGEKGPELFVPSSSGNIVPNHEMGGSNIVVNVDASGSSVEGDEGQAAELGRMLGAAIQAELIKEKRPGGLLAGR